MVAFLLRVKPRGHRVSPAVFSQMKFVLFCFVFRFLEYLIFFGLVFARFCQIRLRNGPKFPKLRISILTAPIAEANDFVLRGNPWKPFLTSFPSYSPRKPSIARAREALEDSEKNHIIN